MSIAFHYNYSDCHSITISKERTKIEEQALSKTFSLQEVYLTMAATLIKHATETFTVDRSTLILSLPDNYFAL